jgi:hypothetical protein
LYSGDFRSATAKQIADEYNRAWEERCEQEPPPTVLFIHATTEEDKYHDRFVTTTGGGLQIGTSLNGMGKSEFTISLLNTEDAKYVEQTYIDPKLDLQRNLGNSVFFRLRGQ